MQEERYRLVFRGEVLADQHKSVVKKRLKELLKIDDERATALFSGKSVVLRNDADTKTAVRFQTAFKKSGARLRVLPVSAEADQTKPAPSKATELEKKPGKEPEKQLEQEPEKKKETLAERLARQAGPLEAGESAAPTRLPEPQVSEANEASKAPERPTEPVVAKSTKPEPTKAPQTVRPPAEAPQHPSKTAETEEPDTFTIRPAGSNVLDTTEREPEPEVDIDTSHLEVTAPEAAPAAVVAVSESIREVDVSHLTLAELGATLGQPAAPAPPLEVDIEFEMMAPGSPLGVDRGSVVEPVLDFTDVDFSLAEIGAIIGRNPMELPEPPPPPDTSHLSLEEVEEVEEVEEDANEATGDAQNAPPA